MMQLSLFPPPDSPHMDESDELDFDMTLEDGTIVSVPKEIMLMKCEKCGINHICRISEDKRLECKLPFGYRPVNMLSIHQALSLRKSGRNWEAFVQQMNRRDIVAWNEMCLRQRGVD
jgi:hypothetical protein